MTSDRDDSLAPAIRRALQESRTDCPDAGTIAAYADRSLGRGERRDVARHLSLCSRCRETLLLMSRAAGADAPAGPSRFPLYRWPWLAGAAAAGLAVVVWMALPPAELQRPAPSAAAQIGAGAGRENAPAQPADKPLEPSTAVAPSARVEQPKAAAPQRPAAAPQERERSAPIASRDARARSGAPAGPAANEARDRLATAKEQRLYEEQKRETTERSAEKRTPAPPAAPPAPAATPPPRPAESPAKADYDQRPGALMARRSPEFLIASWPPPSAAAALRRAPDNREATSVTSTIAWRVWTSGVVERSSDGGATWSRDTTVDAPAARAIRVPSLDVVWIVGDNGLILRFQTGRGWTRVPPPAPLAFVAIEATDALRATVTASDGRRFTTPDGGVSWK